MAPRTSSRAPAQGKLFEYRLARLRFCQGDFVRRSIDVWPPGDDHRKLAEIDFVAISFDPLLRRSLEVGECKTNSGNSREVDRLFWLRGVGELASADSVTFAKFDVLPRTREFARRLNIQVMDERGIREIEESLDIPSDWWFGFHDPQFGEEVVQPAREQLTRSAETRHAGRFLYGTFWFTDDFTRVKQLRTLFGLLTENPGRLAPEVIAVGVGEAVTLLVLTALSIASWRNQLDSHDFRQLLNSELTAGLGNPNQLRALLRRVDHFQRDQIERLHATYQMAGAGRQVFQVTSLESEILHAPEWVEAFESLIERFYRRADLATGLLRRLDLWAAGLAGGVTTFPQLKRLDLQFVVALELVTSFLTRHWNVPDALLSTTRGESIIGTEVTSNEAEGASGKATQLIPELENKPM